MYSHSFLVAEFCYLLKFIYFFPDYVELSWFKLVVLAMLSHICVLLCTYILSLILSSVTVRNKVVNIISCSLISGGMYGRSKNCIEGC